MSAGSWIAGIQGLTTLLTGAASALQRRTSLLASGTPVFDDGTQTVLGGIQVLAGTGAWDTKSGTILVNGSGARTITIPNPDPTLQYPGLQILLVDGANAGGSTLTTATAVINGGGFGPTGAAGFVRLLWLSSNQWRKVS